MSDKFIIDASLVQQHSEMIKSLHEEIKRLENECHEKTLAYYGLSLTSSQSNVLSKVNQLLALLGIDEHEIHQEDQWKDTEHTLDLVIKKIQESNATLSTPTKKTRVHPDHLEYIKSKIKMEQFHHLDAIPHRRVSTGQFDSFPLENPLSSLTKPSTKLFHSDASSPTTKRPTSSPFASHSTKKPIGLNLPPIMDKPSSSLILEEQESIQNGSVLVVPLPPLIPAPLENVSVKRSIFKPFF